MEENNYNKDVNSNTDYTKTYDTYDPDRMHSRVFNTRDEAEEAYNDLRGRGYSDDDVTLMMSDDTRNKYFKDTDRDTDLGDKAMENAGKGSIIGGGIGAVVGAVAAIGTNVLLPGLGLVVAGPIAAGLAGAGAGALTGGLIGALTGAGVPKDEAEVYEQRIKDGGIYMGFKPKNEDDYKYYNDRWSNRNVNENL